MSGELGLYESWSGGDPMFDVGKVHEMYPEKTCFY
jgi:hypothetical protein